VQSISLTPCAATRSSLVDHMVSVAVVGRVEPGRALACIASALSAARSRLQGMGATSPPAASAPGDPPPNAAATAEEAWWLLGFAGNLLADEAKGEAPLVPDSLRALSHAAARSVPSGSGIVALAEADPVVRASSEALRLCEAEAGGASGSPLLMTQVSVYCIHYGARPRHCPAPRRHFGRCCGFLHAGLERTRSPIRVSTKPIRSRKLWQPAMGLIQVGSHPSFFSAVLNQHSLLLGWLQASYTMPWPQDSAGHPPWGLPCCQLGLVFWVAVPSSTLLCRQVRGSRVCVIVQRLDSNLPLPRLTGLCGSAASMGP